GVDRHARSVQVQMVRNPVRHRTKRSGGEARLLQPGAQARVQLETGLGNADKDSDRPLVTVVKHFPRIAAVFHRFPTTGQGQLFLRMDVWNVGRGDMEEQGTEIGKPPQKPPPPKIALDPVHRLLRIGIVESFERPTARGDLSYAVLSAPQVLPKF